tara:strand:- start:443 stop:1015 length:573 start_codon:yes stop_codon:yes gene_type:complete
MLHNALKTKTHEAHMRLHVHSFTQPLQSATLTRVEYERILKGFYTYYSALEHHYEGVKSDFGNIFDPVAALEKDFQTLGISPPKNNSFGKAVQTDLPADFDHYIGYLYVKQGSTLGGQIMSKNIERTIGLDRDKKVHFFNPYGKSTGPVWKSFLAYLERIEDSVCMDSAIHGANHAFSAMEQAFDQMENQ